MNDVNLTNQPALQEQQSQSGYLMVYDKKDQKAKGVTGIDPDGNLETVDATTTNHSRFMKVDQHGNILSNFGSNFMYSYRNPLRFVLYDQGNKVSPEQSAKNIEAAQQSPDEAVRKSMNSNRIYNDHRFNACEVDWELAGRYGLTESALEKTGDLQRILKGEWSENLYNVSKSSELGREGGEAKLSLFRDEKGAVKFDLHYIRQAMTPGEEFRGHKLNPEDVERLNKTGNMGEKVDLVIDYTTGQTGPCYISKDLKTNDMFYLPADRLSIPSHAKNHTFTQKETEILRGGGETESIQFTSSNGKPFHSSVQVNAQKRGIEFMLERGLNHRQSQTQQQRNNQHNAEKNNQQRRNRNTITPR